MFAEIRYLPKFKLEDDEDDSGTAETMFYSAETDFELGNYAAAKIGYQQVVEQYPESKFAKASIKQLFSVEKYEANDYNALKQYFISNSTIVADSVLTKLGNFFGNRCNLKLQNWPDAITWFENVIQSPPSFPDSIYAIIDLGHTYLLMQNGGNKSSHYTGSMPQYIPESEISHMETTNYLLSLLPRDKNKNPIVESIESLKPGELLQNVPNPFNNTTQIWYKLDEQAVVNVSIFDYTGKCIKSINRGAEDKGTHHINFTSEGLSAGIYFYCLEVNGKITDSKKMTILR